MLLMTSHLTIELVGKFEVYHAICGRSERSEGSQAGSWQLELDSGLDGKGKGGMDGSQRVGRHYTVASLLPGVGMGPE